MNGLDYTPEEALKILMARVRNADADLADEVQAAIDQGRDIQLEDFPGGRKNARSYRKTVPYSPEDALQVALNSLNAHFVELSVIVNSCLEEMLQVVVGEPRRQRQYWEKEKPFAVDQNSKGKEKQVEIELVTPTQLPRETTALEPLHPTFRLERTDPERTREQQENLRRLRELTNFEQ